MNEKRNLHTDIQKVELLFCTHYKVLTSYAFRFINDRYAAENIVQDLFFELWNNRENIDFEAGIKTYLFKSVYHRCLNHINNPLSSRQTGLDQLTENEQLTQFIISQDKGPEYQLMMEELDKEINTLIDKLPPQCKKVFILSRKEELKNKEIAEKLGISVKAVEKHISKAISFLRDKLKDRGILLLLLLIGQ